MAGSFSRRIAPDLQMNETRQSRRYGPLPDGSHRPKSLNRTGVLDPSGSGLHLPQFETDNCGWGLIAHIDGQPSHRLVETSIKALANLTHRGAVAADGKTGDGCGLLMAMPTVFLRAAAAQQGIELSRRFGIGMLFLNPDVELAAESRRMIEEEIVESGYQVAGWRPVPIDESALGEEARKTLPTIEQVFVTARPGTDEKEFERALIVARRRIEKRIPQQDDQFYIVSLSCKTLLYKGLVMPEHLKVFYTDLDDADLQSSMCLFHQRFSTNTLPEWRLAQPFRLLAHNGEINTIAGNRNWSRARRYLFRSPLLPEPEELFPLVDDCGSDSMSLDNMLEILLAGGIDVFRAMNLLVPPAWQNVETMDPELRAFHRYNSMHMEPWDGPAGIVLSDGRYAACVLDRNGLRPARYLITNDRHIVLATEAGVVDLPDDAIVEKGRLKPGEMIAVDTRDGKLLTPEAIADDLKARKPYKDWLKAEQTRLVTTFNDDENRRVPMNPASLRVYEKLYGVSFEERDQVIRVLAEAGQEAVGSMGDDTPFAVLSRTERSIYDYFRQQFAQVTNPPIDPLREQIVMSLETCFGRERNVFEQTREHAARVVVDSPILSNQKFRKLEAFADPRYRIERVALTYGDDETLEQAIRRVCVEAAAHVEDGATILVLTDRDAAKGRVPIHALLALGAIHHFLIDEGVRCHANLVVETATARNPHEIAVLIGYGATAVYPYLAFEIVNDMLRRETIKESESGDCLRAYRRGLNKGLHKIMSKMGISTIASYRGAQLFEAVGMNQRVVDLCFKGTVCRIQGTDFDEFEADQKRLCDKAWDAQAEPTQGGLLKYVHGGEYHAYNPDVVGVIHEAVETGDMEKYREFSRLVDNRPAAVLRDLLTLSSDRKPIPVDQVESCEKILKRFDSAGMSLGALSPEAHEAIAIAMNSIGGRSNSGEGGEDPARYGTAKMSKIKQVASGRFGVTPEYLTNAEVLQIKVAQGAKPGEGGQLPGHKVNDLIARLRYSSPGVALISPPPHHDIYSIEDLAQLIFDLKQVNPSALVSVKLVAEAGVGTIAAGVTKCYADLITIAGYDGGTGASPLTSVKYAGSPWEIGLAETRQVLRANGLRGRVRIQTDGGLKTGLDVVKAAIIGAESFGFGTMPMIALGCKYLRICHLNNCATGVATQHATLRKRHFAGSPERVVNYFRFVAEDVREHLAALGYRSIDEVIGQTQLLTASRGDTARQQNLDLSHILSDAGVDPSTENYCVVERNHPADKGALAEKMLEDAMLSIEGNIGGEFRYAVKNTDRSIGARLSGEIARRYGNNGMSEPVTVRLKGTAGQSFGVWNVGGLNLLLEGDANDYVGKGMAGGSIVIKPPASARYKSEEATIIGNTCLYGATGGKLYASGRAGERFAVRNSGAVAVIEGCGDHGCEYMTGGIVISLGPTGLNFGAGMTGGLAFVLDQERTFVDCYNHELIDVHRLTAESMEAHLNYLKEIIDDYVLQTGSRWGMTIQEDFLDIYGRFWLVKPKATDMRSLLDTLMQAA